MKHKTLDEILEVAKKAPWKVHSVFNSVGVMESGYITEYDSFVYTTKFQHIYPLEFLSEKRPMTPKFSVNVAVKMNGRAAGYPSILSFQVENYHPNNGKSNNQLVKTIFDISELEAWKSLLHDEEAARKLIQKFHHRDHYTALAINPEMFLS